jgi:hypothetical protein
MTQGLQSRLNFANRGGRMGWLRHKIYLARLWTGAYMLDHWEALLFLFLALFLLYLAASALLSQSPSSPTVAITTSLPDSIKNAQESNNGHRAERE